MEKLFNFKKYKTNFKRELIAGLTSFFSAIYIIVVNASILSNGDLFSFGKLMNESHISLKEDYEVTGIELDTLVELAWNHEGTIGSRMTGAGFGGCTVSLVKRDKVGDFIKKVGQGYEEKIGYEASFYIANVGDGTREI